MDKTKPMPPSRNSSSRPPTVTLVATNDLLRDVMVKLRHPKKVSGLNDPYEELAQSIYESVKPEVSTEQLNNAIRTMMDRKLLGYQPEKLSFHLTQKAVKVFEELYVVICSNCGASNVKPCGSDSTNSACRRCKQKI